MNSIRDKLIFYYIFLDDKFAPKIGDFGFACINTENVVGNLGTKGY